MYKHFMTNIFKGCAALSTESLASKGQFGNNNAFVMRLHYFYKCSRNKLKTNIKTHCIEESSFKVQIQ